MAPGGWRCPPGHPLPLPPPQQPRHYLGPGYPTGRPRRSSCMPRQSRRRTLAPGPPCRRSAGARTRSSACRTPSCSAWEPERLSAGVSVAGCGAPSPGPRAPPAGAGGSHPPSSMQSSPSSPARSVLIEDLLEDVFEAPVVGFEDGVLGAHVERPLLLDGVLEAAVSEARDGLQRTGADAAVSRDPGSSAALQHCRTPTLLAWPQAHSRAMPALGTPMPPTSTSSVLYMPMPTPPPGKLYTSHSFTPLPSFGVKTILNVPDLFTTKSVALYCRGDMGCHFRAGGAAGTPGRCTGCPAGSPGRRGHACRW